MQDNKYEREFSNWLYDNLPKSTEWQWISDIDFFLYNVTTKRFLIIELKTRWNEMQTWQKMFYWEIHKRLMQTNEDNDMKFVGTYCIEFEWTNWSDGLVQISWTEIKEKQHIYQNTLQEFLYEKLNIKTKS